MDCRSFVFAFKAWEQFLGVLKGKSVHCVSWKMGFVSTLLVQNGLVHFYGMRGCLGLARQVFDEISERDVVSWTSMIDGYSKHRWCDEAVKLFDSMLMYSDVKPNEVTMISFIMLHKRDLRLGKTCHEYVKTRNVTRGCIFYGGNDRSEALAERLSARCQHRRA
uniref:Pentatricopeptide repeat-containing protein n=1 Tax=Salix viminalis TaxID=40686 RepID=A0A6N2M7Y1_SALVM